MNKKIALILMVTVLLLGTLSACAPAPAVEEAAPVVEEAAPAVEEAAPAVEEAAPAVEEPAAPPEVVLVGSDETITAEDFGYDAVPLRDYNIAVIVKSAAIPVWESHVIAAQKAGAALGVNIFNFAPAKADNVEEQKRILEDIITMDIDCVVLAPANTEAVAGHVNDLYEAGIPVVYDNTMGPQGNYLSFVGVDSIEAGNVIAKAVGEAMGGEGKLLILEGVPGQSTSDLRTQGVKEYMDANYPNIEYESQTGHWQLAEGRTITQDYIVKWGADLKGIVGVGGNMAEGAIEAVKAAGLEGVAIGGFDVQEPQYVAVENGDEAFTISQSVYDQAYLSVVACVRALNGEAVPNLILTPLNVVTKDNLNTFDERPEAIRNR